jgi:hypothetical protein
VEPKPLEEVLLPLRNKTRRNNDEHTIGSSAVEQLEEAQTRLDRLAEPHVVWMRSCGRGLARIRSTGAAW